MLSFKSSLSSVEWHLHIFFWNPAYGEPLNLSSCADKNPNTKKNIVAVVFAAAFVVFIIIIIIINIIYRIYCYVTITMFETECMGQTVLLLNNTYDILVETLKHSQAVLPQYQHNCGLTCKCGYLGQYTRIIPTYLTKTFIIPVFSQKNPQL